MTPDLSAKLAEWERLEKAATPGPWELWTGNSWRRIGSGKTGGTVFEPTTHHRDGTPDLVSCPADFAFVTAARAALPELIAIVRQQDAEIERLKNAKCPHDLAAEYADIGPLFPKETELD
mgnify:CR=1 FL=1